MSGKVLIGTGFWSGHEDYPANARFFGVWLKNTYAAERNVVVVNNSVAAMGGGSFRVITCDDNLGHACGVVAPHCGLLCGWSMSWILPAMVAYADGCDFVYKEQDCLAFGDWLPEICKGGMAFGRSDVMPCEQSLFWIRHDHILPVVTAYLNMPERDTVCVTEEKFVRLMGKGLDVQFFDMPYGRNRPSEVLPFNMGWPWYAQRWTADELAKARELGLL